MEKLTERGLWRNKPIKSLSSRVNPIANIINPSDKLYEAGLLLTNHAKADGLKQATTPPVVTYSGYKLAAVFRALSNPDSCEISGSSSPLRSDLGAAANNRRRLRLGWAVMKTLFWERGP